MRMQCMVCKHSWRPHKGSVQLNWWLSRGRSSGGSSCTDWQPSGPSWLDSGAWCKEETAETSGRPVINLVSDPDLWHWIYFTEKKNILICSQLCLSLSGKASDTLLLLWRSPQSWIIKVRQIICDKAREYHIYQDYLTLLDMVQLRPSHMFSRV